MNANTKRAIRQFLPQRLKPHRILSGVNKGKKIVTSWHDYPAAIVGYNEKDLLEWFQQNVKAGQTWIDVGAHYGNTSLTLSGMAGETGRVFAFEPNLASVGCLNQMRRINRLQNLSIMPFGLADVPHLTPIQLPESRGMVDSTLKGSKTAFMESLLIVNFDTLWGQICGDKPHIDGVKIDVQGMEIAVLKGMAKTLKEHRPTLLVETHAGVSRTEFLDVLRSIGYRGNPVAVGAAPNGSGPVTLVDDQIYHFPLA